MYAQYSMGIFTMGLESRNWFEKAANQGHIDSMYYLARTYHIAGSGITQKDFNYYEAEKWHRKASEYGHTGSMKDLGVLLFYGFKSGYDALLFVQTSQYEHVEAAKWFKKVIEDKDTKDYIKAEAMYYLARSYDEGLGVRLNKIEALHWYGLSCDLGYSSSCSIYADMKKKGY